VVDRLIPPPASLPHRVGAPVSTTAMPLLSHRLLRCTELWGSQIYWHLSGDVCWGLFADLCRGNGLPSIGFMSVSRMGTTCSSQSLWWRSCTRGAQHYGGHREGAAHQGARPRHWDVNNMKGGVHCCCRAPVEPTNGHLPLHHRVHRRFENLHGRINELWESFGFHGIRRSSFHLVRVIF
jgi:hypothetical protein